MKLSPKAVTKRAVNTALIPVNAVIMLVNMTIKFVPLVWVVSKFLAQRPKWALDTYRDVRRIGLYQFVDRKGRQFNVLLMDSHAFDAINDPYNNAARQFVLAELKRQVAVDKRCPEFEVPDAIYLWGHPAKGFKKIERLRDATRQELKEVFHPVRDAVTGYLDDVA